MIFSLRLGSSLLALCKISMSFALSLISSTHYDDTSYLV
jgi:hypothetical protein